ncbi:hypothetical protein MMC13_003161 [Lambiella insularis]|nr:hypothetical protein [Lambiella insularis]
MASRLFVQRRLSLSRPSLLLSCSLLYYGIFDKRSLIYNDGGKDGQPPTLRLSKRKTVVVDEATIPRSEQSLVKDDVSPSSDEEPAWTLFSNRIASVGNTLSSIEWSNIGESITDYILPDWAKALPGFVRKLQLELEMAPGSLADEIWLEASDPYINPEIARPASVRISKELCEEEKDFQQRRGKYVTEALARYLNVPEEDVHPDDVPTIAMCGSGGGLRALVAGTGSYLSAQEAGLFDCVTYTAGVSGSCWLQALYHSSLGGQRHDRMVDHLKRRIGIHIAFPPAALNLLTSAPTNKFLLSGFVEKLKGDSEADFGVVDAYGLLLAARLLVPRGELAVDTRDLKLSNQRAFVDRGANPLPIYTAVRHEIPLDELKTIKEKMEGGASEETKEKAKQEAWFQWFEFTPYEFWCEELEAGIPSWSLGRKFRNGKDVPLENGLGLPELRVPQLLGIWGSAFCATLSHYYKEIRPVVQGISMLGGIDDLMEERNDDLIKVHPIEPASVPNYALGLEGQLPATCPKQIFSSSHLQLMDAGMSNNLPIYPLLRPGRNVDILIAFDASADIKKENWLSVADGYAKQRGVKGWPVGLGWPKKEASEDQAENELEAAQASTAQQAAMKVAEAREQQRKSINTTQNAVEKGHHTSPDKSDLGYCTIWVGSTQERDSDGDSPKSKRMDPDADWEVLTPDAGIAVIYFPFLPNPKVDGVDPNTSDFMSTWNFVYTPEQIDKVVALARANFEEGREQTKRCVRAVYERKRKVRVAREEKERAERWRWRLEEHGDHFWR